MTIDFFTKDSTKNSIMRLARVVESSTPDSDFQKARNEYIELMLSSFLSDSVGWDKNASFNIEKIGDDLITSLNSNENQESDFDEVCAACFRFLIERSMTATDGLTTRFRNFREFVSSNKNKFSDTAINNISFALFTMPLEVIKKGIHSDDLNLLRTFINTHKEHEQSQLMWIAEINEKKEEVSKLKSALEEQANAYNFIGISQGFENLSLVKKQEKKRASALLCVLSGFIFIPIIIEFFIVLSQGEALTLTHALLTMIPATSSLIILIYFFRIALHNYKAIKTEINQIELRKSLCMFIQNYAEYASKIKKNDESALEKFENIIFSNIAMSDEKLPSTFDGLDSIAKMIKSIKTQ